MYRHPHLLRGAARHEASPLVRVGVRVRVRVGVGVGVALNLTHLG